MNAPGDSALIVVLLAVFVACTAYAAGRLHQRWQAAQDREEAYRDGYENGTSNVFSTAVRMLGPKRAARGAAPVQALSAPVQAVSAPVQALSAPEPDEAAPDAPPAAPVKPGSSSLAGGPPALGFPAPQPPPPYAITEPGAVGGVVYQQLRDPRATDGEPPALGERPTLPPVPHPRTTAHPTPPRMSHPHTADHPAPPPVPHPHTADHATPPPVPHPRMADRLRPTVGTANTPANLDELGHAERPELIKIRDGRSARHDDGRDRQNEGRDRRGDAQPPADLDELGRAQQPELIKIRDGRSARHDARDDGHDRQKEARDRRDDGRDGRDGRRDGRDGRGDGRDGRGDAHSPANLDEFGHAERPELIKIREGGSGSGGSRGRSGEGDAMGGGRDGGKAGAAVPVTRRRGGHRATPAEEDTTINQAAEARAAESPTAEAQPDVPAGRHTVPDELVRATTYRLPPDRVFRAKVRESTPLPDEPTTRLPSVPKPRDES